MRCFVFTMLLLVGLIPQAEAKQTQEQSSEQKQYKVQKGDTLWDLSGKHLGSSLKWEQIYQANPELHKPGRRFQKNGKTIVILKPGELLNGVTPVVSVTPVEVQPSVVPAPPVVSTVVQQPLTKTVYVEMVPWWLWTVLALALLLIVLLVYWINRSERRFDGLTEEYQSKNRDLERSEEVVRIQRTQLNILADPVTSGPAFVPEGVVSTTAGQHFQKMAARQWDRKTNRGPIDPTRIKVRDVTAGHGWGRMSVSYADGRDEERILTGQRIYQGVVKFPNRKEEKLHMLESGNDVRHMVNRNHPSENFIFVPDDMLVPLAKIMSPVTST